MNEFKHKPKSFEVRFTRQFSRKGAMEFFINELFGPQGANEQKITVSNKFLDIFATQTVTSCKRFHKLKKPDCKTGWLLNEKKTID